VILLVSGFVAGVIVSALDPPLWAGPDRARLRAQLSPSPPSQQNQNAQMKPSALDGIRVLEIHGTKSDVTRDAQPLVCLHELQQQRRIPSDTQHLHEIRRCRVVGF
jgi:hypothetical protein